jgi:hypothetical protein
MSGKPVFLDQDLLVAYVDGELEPEQRAAVEAALLHDAEAWEAVRLLRLSGEAAARAFADVVDEPVPARLIAAAADRSKIADGAGRRPKVRWTSGRWAVPLAASLAALAIGLGAGYGLRGLEATPDQSSPGTYAPAAASTSDPLAARFESALVAALEKGSEGQSFTYESQNVGHGSVELGRTFTTGFGWDCREFHREETRAGDRRRDNGLACRDLDRGWTVMILPAAG